MTAVTIRRLGNRFMMFKSHYDEEMPAQLYPTVKQVHSSNALPASSPLPAACSRAEPLPLLSLCPAVRTSSAPACSASTLVW